MPPFRLETGWQISGINSIGLLVESDYGHEAVSTVVQRWRQGTRFNHGIINNIVTINAYDGMTMTPGGESESEEDRSTEERTGTTGDSWAG